MNNIRIYLRASTQDQDASRAKQQVTDFAKANGRDDEPSYYTENVSGATLNRPELMRLIREAHKGDILLLEQIDRLTRLNEADWETLKTAIKAKGIVVVSLDLPTSHSAMKDLTTTPLTSAEEYMQSTLKSVNAMLMDMLSATARKDYCDRRTRQAQGIDNNKDKFKGKQINVELHERIRVLLVAGMSYTQINATLGASRATIAKVAKVVKAKAEAETA